MVRESAVLGRHDPPLSVECSWDDRRATVVVRGEVDFATAGILARQLDEVGQTQSGAILGTPSYMAPEQAAGKSKELGPAWDIYALGVIARAGRSSRRGAR